MTCRENQHIILNHHPQGGQFWEFESSTFFQSGKFHDMGFRCPNSIVTNHILVIKIVTE